MSKERKLTNTHSYPRSVVCPVQPYPLVYIDSLLPRKIRHSLPKIYRYYFGHSRRLSVSSYRFVSFLLMTVLHLFREKILPILKVKPVRTASGVCFFYSHISHTYISFSPSQIAAVAVMCKPHRCPHIERDGHSCMFAPLTPRTIIISHQLISSQILSRRSRLRL